MATNPHLNGSVTHPSPGSASLVSRPYYNPAQLLNPRGANVPSLGKEAPRSPRTASTTLAPCDFQFTSPGNHVSLDTEPSISGEPGQANGHDSPQPQTNGLGAMIERMNNVEGRQFVRQPKRRKVETEESSTSKPSFGSSSNGIMGQYVTDKQKKAAQDDLKNRVETVDLTVAADDDGDDGDVVMIQTPNDEEICYGMIQDAKLMCHTVPSPKPNAICLLGPSHWPIVKIVLKRKTGDTTTVIQAYDHTRRIVGNVDPRTAAGLASVLDSPSLQIRTNCRISSRRKEPGEVAGKEVSKTYGLDLVVYGPRKSARPVGRHLSQKNIWLRKPFILEKGIKFENPQDIEAPKPQHNVAHERMMTSSVPQTTRTVEEIRSEVMGVFDSLTRSEDLPTMEPDPIIQTDLLKHQKQGLFFMTNREQPRQLSTNGKTPDSFWQIRLANNGQKFYHNVITGSSQREKPPETFGGILADMMGLGKTLSILSLVAGSLSDADAWSKTAPVQPQAPPLPKNGNTTRQFNVPTPEPLALTQLRQNGKATLLVSPLSTITNWEEQIKAHLKPNALKYYIYHGSNRIKDVKKLAQYDIVLTTYGSVASEVAARNKRRPGPYPLEEIGWFRVVLDEAHMIREQSTLQFKAICRLQANRRWAVTGTPVQNKLDDLAALLAFLRLKPFDERGKFTQYITAPFKVCDPEIVPKLRVLVDSVTLRRLKDKIDLPPRTDQIIQLDFSPAELKLYQHFERMAQDKVQVLAAGREKMIGGKTYIHILQSILRLRLISAHGKDLLNDTDLELLQGMTQESAIDLDSDEEDEKSAMAESRVYEVYELMQETNSDKCVSCQRRIGSNDGADIMSEREEDILGYVTNCIHLLCTSCIKTWDDEVGREGSGDCPLCHKHINFACQELRKSKVAVERDTHHKPSHESKRRMKDRYNDYTGPHTKTRALLDDLLKSKAESEASPEEPPFKSVVFSAWTSHLDLIQIALDKAHIGFTRLDGTMSRQARTAAMDAFRENDSVHVILVSISAGGLGLNLTAGNSVYVMEPQYNPAAEAQAVDRVHRLGQKRPVRAVRYIMNNSIEVKMLELQAKKMKLASLSMDRSGVMDKSEAARQKLMDLRDLFR